MFCLLDILSHPLFCNHFLRKVFLSCYFFLKFCSVILYKARRFQLWWVFQPLFLILGEFPAQFTSEPRSWILLLLFAFDIRRSPAWWSLDSRTHFQGKDQFVSCLVWWGFTTALWDPTEQFLSENIRELLRRD